MRRSPSADQLVDSSLYRLFGLRTEQTLWSRACACRASSGFTSAVEVFLFNVQTSRRRWVCKKTWRNFDFFNISRFLFVLCVLE